MNIFENINRLTSYGLTTGLITREDLIFVKNQLLAVLELDGFENEEQAASIPEVEVSDLEEILKEILDYTVEKKLIEDSVVYRDLFDTKLMAIMTDRPSNIITRFNMLYVNSPK